MNIVKLINKDGVPYGVMIEDGEVSYPISMECLHNPIILDTLLEEGWELHGLPYDLRKDGKTLQSLPAVDYADLAITPDQKQNIIDISYNLYQTVDLKSRIKAGSRSYVQFEPSLNLIKTRQEFIDFLDSVKRNDIDPVTPMGYLPLNSFVAREALFTLEEYVSPENAEYRDIIERRRRLTIRQAMHLGHDLIKLGLPANYTAEELVNKYFSWGVCGIALDALEVKTTKHKNILGTQGALNGATAIKDVFTTYINANGIVYIPPSKAGYKPMLGQQPLQNLIERTAENGPIFVSPIDIAVDSTTDVLEYYTDGANVMIDVSAVLINLQNGHFIAPSLTITDVENGRVLPQRMYNVTQPTVQQEIYEFLFLHALCRELGNRLRVDVDARSFDVLSAMSVGPYSMFKLFIRESMHTEDVAEACGCTIKASDGKVKIDEFSLLDKIETYIKGEMQESDQGYYEIAEYVTNVIAGEYNIGHIQSGKKLDEMSSYKEVMEAFVVAHKYLGVSLEDMAKEVLQVTSENTTLIFRGENKAISVPCLRRDGRYRGFNNDRRTYNIKAADQASQLHFVTSICREIGGYNYADAKHVAVELLTWNRMILSKEKSNIENSIRDIWYDKAHSKLSAADLDAFASMLSVYVARSVFEIYLNGTITFANSIGGEKIQVEESLLQAVRNQMVTTFESTISLCNSVIYGDCEFYHYIVNAAITPEYVIPKGNFEIKERPFIPMWFNHSNLGIQHKGIRDGWVAKDYCPGTIEQGFYGYSGKYNKMNDTTVATNGHGNDPASDPESVTAYYNAVVAYRDAFPTDKDFVAMEHPIRTIYPLMYPQEDTPEYVGRTDGQSTHKWGLYLGETRVLTQATMLQRHPELKRMFEPERITNRLDAPIKQFEGYALEDFNLLKTLDDLKICTMASGKYRMVTHIGTTLLFLNGTEEGCKIDIRELPALDQKQFAVTQLHGRKYVVQDVNGKLWEVRV